MPTDVTLTSALRNYLQSMQNTKRSETAPNAASPDAAGEASACESINKAAQDFCTPDFKRACHRDSPRVWKKFQALSNRWSRTPVRFQSFLSLITNAELAALGCAKCAGCR